MKHILKRLQSGLAKQEQHSLAMVYKAFVYASLLYGDETRKHSDEYSLQHPVDVCLLVSQYTSDIDLLVAAILHDVIEDYDETYNDLAITFGERVADLVLVLSKPPIKENESRAHRNCRYWGAISKHSAEAVLLKLADTFVNLQSEGDPKPFRLRYLYEKATSMLFFINHSESPELENIVRRQIREELLELVGRD